MSAQQHRGWSCIEPCGLPSLAVDRRARRVLWARVRGASTWPNPGMSTSVALGLGVVHLVCRVLAVIGPQHFSARARLVMTGEGQRLSRDHGMLDSSHHSSPMTPLPPPCGWASGARTSPIHSGQPEHCTPPQEHCAHIQNGWRVISKNDCTPKASRRDRQRSVKASHRQAGQAMRARHHVALRVSRQVVSTGRLLWITRSMPPLLAKR
jgi:hypothetical protein